MNKYDYLYYNHLELLYLYTHTYGLTYDEVISLLNENGMFNIEKICLRLGQNSTFLDLVME